MDSPVDHAVGAILHKKIGDPVRRDEPLCTLLVNDESRLPEVEALFLEAYTLASEPPAPQSLLVERIVSEPGDSGRTI
jgi:thymidine phosphorylase